MANGYNDGGYANWNYGGNGATIYQPPPGYLLVQDPRVANTQQNQYGNVVQNSQATSRAQIPARFIESLEEVKPNEVPSDGTISIFIQNDCKAIYAQQVNKRGIIDSVKYVPEMQADVESESSISIDERLNKMETLMDERFSKIEKMINRRNNYYKKPVQQNQNNDSNKEE